MDARTDVWSFGVVPYEMLAGTPPFEGETTSDCIAAVLKKEPPPLTLAAPQLPVRLEEIVRKALRKDKEERYQSVEEMLADLRRLRESSESIVSRASGGKSRWPPGGECCCRAGLGRPVLYLRPTRTVTNTLAGNASPLASAIPEKSIAVLPFENLSSDKDNAFFTDGVQDEILSPSRRSPT